MDKLVNLFFPLELEYSVLYGRSRFLLDFCSFFGCCFLPFF